MSRLIRFYANQSRTPFICGLLIITAASLLFVLSSIFGGGSFPPIAVPLAFLASVFLAWHTLRRDTNKFTLTLAASAGNSEVERFVAKLLVSLGQSSLLFLVTLLFGFIAVIAGRIPYAFNFAAFVGFPVLLIALTGGLLAYFVIPYSYFEEQMQRKIAKLALVIPALILVISTGVLRRFSNEVFGSMPSSIANPTWGGLFILLTHLCICTIISLCFISWRKKHDAI